MCLNDYVTEEEYARIEKELELYQDLREGVERAAEGMDRETKLKALQALQAVCADIIFDMGVN